MLSPADTAKAVSGSMEHKAHMPLYTIIFMSIMAGAAIAMGDIFWAHSTVGMAENQSIGLSNFIGGITFSCGLMMVVFYGGHLFTSSVLSGVSAYEGKLNVGHTIYYWTIVWLFNFAGGALIAYMYYYSGLPLKYDGYILQHFIPSGIGKITAPFHELFIRGIFCNVFVCMSIWTATSENDLSGKFFAIMWMIGAFVACSMEHCVANMFIITEALIAKSHYLAQFGGDLNELSHFLHGVSIEGLKELNVENFLIKNLIPVTLGNIVGGLFFVGLVGFMANQFEMKKDK
ncbi:formate/nitrite transporter family protein [Campylobacter sp. RM13119]|uniref:formate/nitrite transporter family protein n=1 Tax=Campylobacter TaxID=194 RepID=UPI0014766049|nr:MULTISPECIES: formate/nitrite transporter family protein [unclassified Campylobacter]MBE3606381.1 formate/nitrite transporter family protein [Campylobacter sp. RM13119]MBE3609468.1 formate/nitrite transporter family protein [Campylobacter sp. RM12916]